MADKKTTALTATTTPVSTDIVAIVVDPSGTPLSRKVTLNNFGTAIGVKLPLDSVSGLTLSNNGVDPTNDIDIAAGSAVDGTGVYNMTLASAITKRLDAA